MEKEKEILLSPSFIIGVFILLINDFFLKSQFHNFLTGKLSDISGLFIFPLFFSSILKSNSRSIFFNTALFFIFWKSPLSQELIDLFNSFIKLNYNRVVDYTDLLCLPILVISYRYLNSDFSQIKISRAAMISISSFAFIATSRADREWKFERSGLLDEGFKEIIVKSDNYINLNRLNFLNGLTNDSIYFWTYSSFEQFKDTFSVTLSWRNKSKDGYTDVINKIIYVFAPYANPKNENLKFVSIYIKPKDTTVTSEELIKFLNVEISRKLLRDKLKHKNEPKRIFDSLLISVNLAQQETMNSSEVSLIDSLFKYADNYDFYSHQLFSLKASILTNHYSPDKNKEIIKLFFLQDSTNCSYTDKNISQQNEYILKKRKYDFYDLIRNKDSVYKYSIKNSN